MPCRCPSEGFSESVTMYSKIQTPRNILCCEETPAIFSSGFVNFLNYSYRLKKLEIKEATKKDNISFAN